MAKKPREIELLSPTAGLVRRYGYQQQPPFSTPDCLNVRPFDPLESRERTGSRPGMEKAFADPFGGEEAIQTLASVSVADDDGTIRDVLLVIAGGIIAYTDAAGDFQSPYVETTLIGRYVNNGYFEVLDGVTYTFASWTDYGITEAESSLRNTGAYSCKLEYTSAQVDVRQTLTVTAGAKCTLSFWTRGDGTVQGQYSVYNNSTPGYIVSATNTGVTGTTWTKIIKTFTVPAGCTSILVRLMSPTSAGTCYFDDVDLKHRVLTATAVLSTTKRTIPVAGMFQKFYIADSADSDISGTEGVVTSSVLSDYSISDWTTLGIDTDKDVIVITSSQLSELDVTRSVDFQTSSYIVLTGSEIAEGPVSYTINRSDRAGDSGFEDQRARLVDTDVDNFQALGIDVGDVLICGTTLITVTLVEQGMLWISANPSLSDGSWALVDGTATTLVANGTFETAGAGGADVFGSWTEVLDGGAAAVSDETTLMYSGAHACRLHPDNPNRAWVYQNISVTPGRQYVLTWWARVASSSISMRARIEDITNGGDIVAAYDVAITSTYAQKFLVFTAPAGCTTARIHFGSTAAASTAGYDAIVDAVWIGEAPAGGSAGTTSSVYLFQDSDVPDWTEYGITVGKDVLTYYDATDTYYDDFVISEVSSIGLIGTNPSGTAPFDWTITRLKLEGDDGLITNANNQSRLSSTRYPDWDALTFADDDSITLTRPAKTFTAGVYAIDSVASGGVTIDTDEIPDGSEYLYQIGRKIQILDPDTGVLEVMDEVDGVSPLNCSILTSFRGRLVGVFKNTWYMSRVNDPLDWDYGADDQDTARAVAGGVAEAADVPDPVTAAFAHTDDYFIFGCHGSMFILRGDPAAGAEIDRVSPEVGIVGPDAWCHLSDGTLMFLSRSGLYLFSSGGGGYPVPFSENVLPEELINVDGVNNAVSMCFDFVGRGVHLFITPDAGTAGDHWWVHWFGEDIHSLWPVSVPATMQPTCMLAWAASPADPKAVLLGCLDGYVRQFAADASDDDGTNITSYLQIGPFRLGDPGYEGIATRFSATLDEDSGSVGWEFRAGQTGEEAVDSTTALASGTWEAGWNRPASERVRAAVGSIYIAGPTPSAAWAIETVNLTLVPGGIIR